MGEIVKGNFGGSSGKDLGADAELRKLPIKLKGNLNASIEELYSEIRVDRALEALLNLHDALDHVSSDTSAESIAKMKNEKDQAWSVLADQEKEEVISRYREATGESEPPEAS